MSTSLPKRSSIASPATSTTSQSTPSSSHPATQSLLEDLSHNARASITRISPGAPLVEFVVEGNPITQGSYRSFGGNFVPAVKGLKDWREAIGWTAVGKMQGRSPSVLPIEVELDFVVPTPKKREGELWPIQHGTGDIDKLSRAALDALTRLVYVDDSQVVRMLSSKRYGGFSRPVGLTCRVWEISLM